MNWTSRPQLVSAFRDQRNTLSTHSFHYPNSAHTDHYGVSKLVASSPLENDNLQRVNMAFESSYGLLKEVNNNPVLGSHKQLNQVHSQPSHLNIPLAPDSLHSAIRSDSLPSPTSPTSPQTEFPVANDYEEVLFDFMKVSAEDIARQITLMFLPVFKAIQPDELTSVAWYGKDKEVKAPNVVRFTHLFNRINFWVHRCILEKNSTASSRASVMAHFIKIAKKLRVMHNIHACYAIISALQAESIYRLKRTWPLVNRKALDNFDRLAQFFSIDQDKKSNWKSLRGLMEEIKLPVIPYLGMYTSDLVVIDTTHPSTGGLDSQARKDKMNNICRIISEYQQSEYNFTSKEHIRRYLDAQSHIKEMETFIEAENHKLSLELEPPESQVRPAETLRRVEAQDSRDNEVLRSDSLYVANHLTPQADGVVTLRPIDHNLSNQKTHRKSKSVGDASMSHGVSQIPNGQGVVSVHRANTTISHDVQRNLIDDSPAFAEVSASSDNSFHIIVKDERNNTLNSLNSSSMSTDPCTTCQPGAGSQNVELAAPVHVVCRGFLQRKTIYKNGKKQSMNSYSKFWAELVIVKETGFPILRLYAPGKPFPNLDKREDFKKTFAKAQFLNEASVAANIQCSDPQNTFQINFDSAENCSRVHPRTESSNFSSYRYRVTPRHGPTTKQWFANINTYIQQYRRSEKSLIDFSEDDRFHTSTLNPRKPVSGFNNNRSQNSLDMIEESTQL